MNRARRAVLVVYCVALALACLWVPWRVDPPGPQPSIRLGYGFVWYGPKPPEEFSAYQRLQSGQAAPQPPPGFVLDRGTTNGGERSLAEEFEQFRRESPRPPEGYEYWQYYKYAQVDGKRLSLEIAALTALCAIPFVVAPLRLRR